MCTDSYAVREATVLTPHKIASRTTFLEWDTQPSLFKQYPRFCYRISLHDVEALAWMSYIRCITSLRTVAQKHYYQLNVPSAGNLHPLEIYVQVRNVAGVLCGIYHLDVISEQLVLIQEIEDDGVEGYMGMENRFNGFIIMMSIVPFRSSWKYGLRAWRYCYLDLGHQIGAFHAAMSYFGLETTKMSHCDGQTLNRMMGMGDEEYIAAVYGIGETGKRRIKELKTPLISVQPTNYTIKDKTLSMSIQNTPMYLEECNVTKKDNYPMVIRTRRSAREFFPAMMSDDVLTMLMDIVPPKTLEVIAIVMQAHSMQHGVYRNGNLDIAGDYKRDVIHLLLGQRFIANANMVLLIHAQQFTDQAHIEAGIFTQEIYLACEETTTGCSGIGAFYDNEGLQWSNNPLLYAVAIGGKQ